jgi:hypothetical protein
MNDLPTITPDELKILVMAFEDGVPPVAAAPLVAKGWLMRCPPHYLLTDTGRGLLIQHAHYKPFLVQARESTQWVDFGRTWTLTGAYGLMARLNIVCSPCHYRILDEDRKVIFTSET